MTNLPKNFCVAPFLQLTTHPSGSFSPCPYLGGTSWAGQYNSIQEIWRSSDLQGLRQQFINNEQPGMCNRCWHEETNQKQSLRLRLFDPVNQTSEFSFVDSNTLATRLTESIDNESYLAGPEVLTIKNGNVCNAKCRVCHPNDSSRWIEDADKLHKATGKVFYNLTQQERNWSEDQIAEILDLSRSLKRLELFGGEPMYNKKVHHILEQMVISGESKHIILYINTNGSVNIAEKFPFIKEFQQVEIGLSIDGVGSHFEYIRHGINYGNMVENVKQLRQYLEDNNVQHSLDSITTVQIQNVLYLPEIKKAVMEILPLSPFWNLLTWPSYLFIKNMPESIKEAVINKLSTDTEFNDLINVIRQPADLVEWDRFLEVTFALDAIRGENFRTVFPEMSELIDKC
jgi:MoaA/NifB/PqqE/SkfB family radical SAM enzyme